MRGMLRLALLGVPGAQGESAPEWTPADIEGLAAWYKSDTGLYTDAAKTTVAASDDDLIYTWADQSGNGNDLVQATEGARPKLKIIATVPFVRTDGIDDTLGVETLTAGAAKTIFVVGKKNAAAGPASQALFGLSSTADVFAKSTLGDASQWKYERTETTTYPDIGGTVTALSVICLKYTAANSLSIYIDGGEAVTIDPNDSYATSTSFTVGARTSNSLYIDADYAEILIYNTALSDPERNTVESYLASRWTNPT